MLRFVTKQLSYYFVYNSGSQPLVDPGSLALLAGTTNQGWSFKLYKKKTFSNYRQKY